MSNNRIEGSMEAPQQESKYKIREGLELPPEGPNQMICIGMVDIGTHSESFNGNAAELKRKVIVFWEKPDLKQLVYESDTEPRTYQKGDEMMYYMSGKSKLLKICKAIHGKNFTDAEYEKGFNLFQNIGKKAFVMVQHQQGKKDPSKTYVKFDSYATASNQPDPANFIPSNDRYAFFIDKEGKNFMTQNFAELPKWCRDKIKESEEAKEYIKRGGTFAEPSDEDEKAPIQQGDNVDDSSADDQDGVPEGFIFTDLSNQGLNYNQYITAKWTPKMLFDAGYLKKKPEPTPPTAAAVPPATPPPAQTAPIPPAAAAPPVQNPVQTQAPPAQNPQYNPFDDDNDMPF